MKIIFHKQFDKQNAKLPEHKKAVRKSDNPI